MELIDICFNFTSNAFRKDEADVVERANKAGVTRFILTGSNVEDSENALQLSKQYKGMHSTAGVHPHLSKEFTEATTEQLHTLSNNHNVVAIGEAGLDYNRNYSTPQAQKYAFQKQLELATELGIPIFCHERDAYQDFVKLLQQYREKLNKVVVHCFTGNEKELDGYLNLDCHIGITGWICDERRGHHLHEFIQKIPTNRLMIETDAPYLLPRNLPAEPTFPKPHGRRNEPAYLPHILNAVAQIRKCPAEQIAEETTQTAKNFFSIE